MNEQRPVSEAELEANSTAASHVALLHGFLGRGGDWSEIVEMLGGKFRFVTPDLPGHGDAVGLAPFAYTMDGASDRLTESLDAENVEKVTLVGYSMGGRLALHFALRHPDRVEKFVLLSASPGLETEKERIERREQDRQRAQEIENDLRGFVERWYELPLFRSMDRKTRDAHVARRSLNLPAELRKSLAGMGTGSQPSHWEHLHQIRVPSWIVVGARDAKFLTIAQRMATASSFAAVVLPDLGHALLSESPSGVATLLRQLLSS